MPDESNKRENRKLFQRQHYYILAARIREQYGEAEFKWPTQECFVARRTLETLAISLCHRFAIDNIDFSPTKFLYHCSPDPELYPLQELWEKEGNA